MTNKEWAATEKALQGLFGGVDFEIDGYTVQVRRERISESKLALCVYINGTISGKALMEESDERIRFWQRCTRSLLSQKQKKDMAKWSKKRQAEFREKFSTEYVYYQPYFNSFKTMKATFIKNNSDIKITKIDGKEYLQNADIQENQ